MLNHKDIMYIINKKSKIKQCLKLKLKILHKIMKKFYLLSLIVNVIRN